jgi:hypothetical protein
MKFFTIHQMAAQTGGTLFPILQAIKATGLKGRLRNGERVWTSAEFAQIKAAM